MSNKLPDALVHQRQFIKYYPFPLSRSLSLTGRCNRTKATKLQDATTVMPFTLLLMQPKTRTGSLVLVKENTRYDGYSQSRGLTFRIENQNTSR